MSIADEASRLKARSIMGSHELSYEEALHAIVEARKRKATQRASSRLFALSKKRSTLKTRNLLLS